MRVFKRSINLLVLALALHTTLSAQNALVFQPESSNMTISGTSTLHDWESVVEDIKVSATLDNNNITDVNVTIKSESIKSGKNGMDKNTYNALMTNKYPNINFTASTLSIDGATLKGKGAITIAGTTKTIPVALTFESWTEDSYLIRGSVPIKMTDYGIEPPKAMMGTIKTGDDLTIDFEISLNTNK